MSIHVDAALLEMFAVEVEAHMAVLNDGLLALEQNHQQSAQFESLMRAAHSIKGAAKLVGLQAAVDVAHVIEDSFVAAREGRLAMTSELVDVLLAGVDLLGRAAEFNSSEATRVSEEEVTSTVKRILQASSAHPAAATVASASPAHSAVFRPLGNLDADWVDGVHREIGAILLQGAGGIAFDLARTEAIDSVGLALLANVARHSQEGHGVQFHNTSRHIERLLHTVGLAEACQFTAIES